LWNTPRLPALPGWAGVRLNHALLLSRPPVFPSAPGFPERSRPFTSERGSPFTDGPDFRRTGGPIFLQRALQKPRPAGQQQGGANQESARSHRALRASLPPGLRGTIHGVAIQSYPCTFIHAKHCGLPIQVTASASFSNRPICSF
jgi:hypothetical protein